MGTSARPDAAVPSRWAAVIELGGIVSETVAYPTCAGQLLESLGRTVDPGPRRLTFVEVDDAIHCVSRARSPALKNQR